MNAWFAALWAEVLKARRSRILIPSLIGLAILPGVAGLFMVILKNPEQARALGLISLKARLAAGNADWPTFYMMLTQGAAIGSAMLYAIITAWVFGREFSDRTAKDLLALPVPRVAFVIAKLVVLGVWIMLLTLWIAGLGLAVGAAVDIPGGSAELNWTSFQTLLGIGLLNFLLMPFVALAASAGRGYLPPVGWAFLTTVFAQISVVLGWGDWFPWAVPALFSGMAGPRAEQVGTHSYVLVIATFVVGVALTVWWWRDADQAR
jgi:ABC-2 type transport system permease protein